MFRALQAFSARRRARREAAALTHCDRMITAAAPARRAVLVYAANHCADPFRRERQLAALTAAFNYGA
jgi:hypothetical protein